MFGCKQKRWRSKIEGSFDDGSCGYLESGLHLLSTCLFLLQLSKWIPTRLIATSSSSSKQQNGSSCLDWNFIVVDSQSECRTILSNFRRALKAVKVYVVTPWRVDSSWSNQIDNEYDFLHYNINTQSLAERLHQHTVCIGRIVQSPNTRSL